MKINAIVNKTILFEMIPTFLINLFFFTFIFLMTTILDITNMIINYKIDMTSIALMLIYSMPFFLEFIIPMSIMMAVLLTFLRMSSDNEIVALKASGVSIYRLLPPVLFFCLLGCLLTGFMAIYALPWGRVSFKELAYQIAIKHVNVGVKERVFNDTFEGIMLYVSKIDPKSKELIDVFIEDQRTGNIVSSVVAPTGRLISNPEELVFNLKLNNGSINQVNLEKKSVHTIQFDTYEINLDLKKTETAPRDLRRDEEELSIPELKEIINTSKKKDTRYYMVLIEFHKKFSIPFACFTLGLLALPLGIRSKSARKSFGVGLGLAGFMLYYILLTIGWAFGETDIYPPLVGMWVPNIVIGLIGIYILYKTANDRPLIIDGMSGWIKRTLKPSRAEYK